MEGGRHKVRETDKSSSGHGIAYLGYPGCCSIAVWIQSILGSSLSILKNQNRATGVNIVAKEYVKREKKI